MARLKLNLPERKIFETEIDVRVYDINYGNHLGHDRLVSILHDARRLFLDSLGFTELNIDGTGIIISDLLVQYQGEAHLGDVLSIDIFIDEIKRKSFELYYSVYKQKTIRIAKAKTGVVCYDYSLKKTVSIPQLFIEKLNVSTKKFK